MPLLPLKLPSGIYRNGTDFQGSGRWRDANLVRWVDGTMRPVRGWEERVQFGAAPPRSSISWQDNSGNRYYCAGAYNALEVSFASNTTYDITPADLTDGIPDAAINTGYSGGFYGLGFYGTSRTDTGNYSEATTWSLDNFGEHLVACSTSDGRLLEWQLDTATNAAPITNAPIDNSGLLVTEERFLFALGAGGSPRKVQWCDRENNTVWSPLATNEAGDIELQTAGQIMQGIRTRGQSLIITDIDAHSATYIGGQFVYGFQRVGSSCGSVSRQSAAAVDEGVFWMGQRGFFVYAGGAVQDIPCEVADYVFNDINSSQVSKTWAVTNQQYNEIWWFYCSAASNEIDRYVTYNYKERHWNIGHLSRTTGVDRGVFRRPIWFSASGKAYNQDTGLNYDGADVFVESGPISIGNGDAVMAATMLYPDEKTQGDVSATFKTRFHPNDVERSYGPYELASPTPVRFSGRQVRMRIEGDRLADWRVGVMRLDTKVGGKR